MCHHLVDAEEKYWVEEPERAEDPVEEATDEPDEPVVDVELDHEYDERDVKTPGDD